MSKITPEEVRRVAALANIGLQEHEIEHFSAELDQIVGFVEQLQNVDVEGVVPTDQVTGLVDVWREDTVTPSLSYDELKLNAPGFQDGHFKVKRVLGGE
jgi:aspartyl-tRNA(Asn)/glutamyl-tRNA(Gln) amidotransferase subunit C